MVNQTPKLLTNKQILGLDDQQKALYLKWLRYQNYLTNPQAWIAEQSPFTPAPYQLEILEQAADWSQPVNRIAVRAPRGGG